MDTTKKSSINYKPKNPNDPKMPNLTGQNREEINSKVKEEIIEKVFKTTKVGDDEPFSDNSKAKSLINSLKQKLANKEDEDKNKDDNEESKPKMVMPDPTSDLNIVNHLRNRGSISNRILHQNTKDKMKTLREDHRISLKKDEIDLIAETFREKVVRVSPNSVVLKISKFGLEIYKNNVDKRYWVVAICFDELFNPAKLAFTNFWTGGAFIGYGFDYLEETIEKAKDLSNSGRTGNIYWKDFVVDWNKETNRFVTSDEPKQFKYSEYKKIIEWYKQNKVRICVKNKNRKDYEDLMKEVKEKKAKGEFVSPLASLQAKMIDKPRKATFVFGYPVEKSDYKGKEYVKPENKLYEIGFAFTD
ncbi:hypothetical protein SCORR_v1c02240 [Spiroplasma corruscae]|uniref:Uncharacterized protein n=1 Tax=Spiroplasma corruscae TaxID=216934 RepID=A0A222ENC4_9MOLU|nr:hypothetical protein [Spiroplasma corruscae]ASP27999.1 hypothetical protein SCORR_v1c02240 [Spiroplasma corruscae]